MPSSSQPATEPDELERDVDHALRDAGAGEIGATWRRVVRELRGAPRVGVCASNASGAVRAIERLEARFAGVQVVALALDPPEDPPRPAPPVVQDVLFGVHAVVWVTPVGQALGARERRALDLIEEAVGPDERHVVIVDLGALERMSDDPGRELAMVRARLEAEAPRWQIWTEAELEPLVARVRARSSTLAVGRLRAVAGRVLDLAAADLERAVAEEMERVQKLEAMFLAEDHALDEARRLGERAAAFTLGVLRRRTEELLVDLRGFLRDLEADIEPQVAAMADVEQARQVLAHWLDHVVQNWLRDRVAAWRAQVAADLRDVRVSEEALAMAELLIPELQPPPFPSDGRWRRAVGLTAGLGGAAVLAAFQLWIPAAIVAAGGVAWSVLDRDPADTRRERLTEQARAAVRGLGLDAERALNEQLQAFEGRLAGLGGARAGRTREERAEVRAHLETRLALHRARLDEAIARRDPLLLRRSQILGREGE